MKKFRFLFDFRRTHRFIIVVVIFSFGIIVQPCSSEPLSIEGEKNRLTICTYSPVVSLDPTNYRSRDTQIVLKNMFDSLTTRDADMNVVPQLAQSWQALTDTTWELTLRRGVKFQNGADFTAEDVKFTLERVIKEGVLDGGTSSRKSLLGPLTGVKIINEYTVQLETETPWAILPLMLSLQEIVPKKYMEAAGSQGFQNNPVGTGPFKFVRAEGDNVLILERFDEYYGGSPEIPPVQTAPVKYLLFKTVPDKIELIAMLKKGECDIINQVSPEAIRILQPLPGIEVLSCPATRSYFAEINSVKPPFNDQRIRLAMNYAVDIQAVVDHILQGQGEALPTVLLPNAFAYNAFLKPYPYNPKLAKELLHDAGFPEGRSITINCIKGDRQFASIIASFLTRVGVKSVITVVDSWRPKTVGPESPWDIFIGSWGNSTLDPVGILVPKFKSGGRGNFSGYSNAEVDTLLAQAEATIDPQLREQSYKKIQEIIYNDVPMIFGYAAEEFYGVNERVQNFAPSSSGMLNMHDVSVRSD